MPPAIAYISYSTRVLCSLVTLILNPIILYHGNKSQLKYAQTSLLLFDLVMKILLALCTLVNSICILVEDSDLRHAYLVFWTTLCHQALLVVATYSDFFLTIDRIIAISYPLKYVQIRKKLVVCAAIMCTVIYLAVVALFITNKTSKISLIWLESISPDAAIAVFCFMYLTMVPLTCINAVFLWKLRLYNKRVALQSRGEDIFKMVNNIVFQQVILSTAVWIIPGVLRLIIVYGLNMEIDSSIQADPTVSLILLYMALCSVMYWRKLVKQNARIIDSSIQADPTVSLILIYMALCSVMYWRKLVKQNARIVEEVDGLRLSQYTGPSKLATHFFTCDLINHNDSVFSVTYWLRTGATWHVHRLELRNSIWVESDAILRLYANASCIELRINIALDLMCSTSER
uniref:G_PROTEIN_RECEP_F1_2 domain-containing protein n=1 Tax=Steinernema glaseri TaxID=37863 RepID=A0A1I7YME2_9BILA